MVNRECPKCGQPDAYVRHNRTMAVLEMRCGLCAYEWHLKPLDILREDKERLEASRRAGVPTSETR